MKLWKFLSAAIILSLSTSVLAAKLNVPSDFPNSFHMDLLRGNMYVFDTRVDFLPTDGTSQILFDATEFDHSGTTGEGQSSLELTSTNDWEIGSFFIFDALGTFFIDGNGSGTLIDNGNGTGDWTLNTPMYAIWHDVRYDFPDFSLSSAATYNVGSNTVNGQVMDYESGDVLLVGQSSIYDFGPLHGFVVTLEIYGNDPVLVSAVPVPAAVWLFGSGLIGLIGIARRKKQ